MCCRGHMPWPWWVEHYDCSVSNPSLMHPIGGYNLSAAIHITLVVAALYMHSIVSCLFNRLYINCHAAATTRSRHCIDCSLFCAGTLMRCHFVVTLFYRLATPVAVYSRLIVALSYQFFLPVVANSAVATAPWCCRPCLAASIAVMLPVIANLPVVYGATTVGTPPQPRLFAVAVLPHDDSHLQRRRIVAVLITFLNATV